MPPEESQGSETQQPTPEVPAPVAETPVETPTSVAETPQPEVTQPVPEPIPEPVPQEQPAVQVPFSEPLAPQPQPQPTQTVQTPTISVAQRARNFLITARSVMQSRKRKKLDRVLELFTKKPQITNDEVEKFLHVSDATATRYLSQLEKEGKVVQAGKTGKGVWYARKF